MLTPLCPLPPKLKRPEAAHMASILKNPHLMLVLPQGIINSLDNEAKLAIMECFLNPSITFVPLFLLCTLALLLDQLKSYFVCVHCAHTDLSVA